MKTNIMDINGLKDYLEKEVILWQRECDNEKNTSTSYARAKGRRDGNAQLLAMLNEFDSLDNKGIGVTHHPNYPEWEIPS